jgi:iron complex outermembrane receptor protein
LKFRLNKLTSVIDASYSYTKAYDTDYDEEKSQLMYIPDNLANASWRLVYKEIYASWNSDFTGIRYITADNSKYLPSYLINSISSGYKIKIKDTLLDLNLNVNNLFDVNYQSIAHFPLPGRTYSIKLSVQLNK